jgi:hypothetical protein
MRYLLTGLVAVLIMAPASAQAVLIEDGYTVSEDGGVATEQFTEFGGARFGPDVPLHLYGWGKVWKTGHSPVGGWTTYRFNGWAKIEYGWDENIDKVKANAWYSNEQWPAADFSIVSKTNNIYGCSVNGRWRANGCFHLVRKGKVVLRFGSDVLTCWPRVEFKIKADSDDLNGGKIMSKYSSNLDTFC